MSKWRIEYRDEFKGTPVSFWVHKNLDDMVWTQANRFDPPLPAPVADKGYRYLVVDALGTELEFASVEEAEHVLSVLSQKNMPSTTQLSRERTASYGPNRHWLSRFPCKLKPWSKRQKLIPLIEGGIHELKSASR